MPGIASSPRRQSAKAPTPGSTTRSALRDLRRIAGDHNRLIVPALARGALERLGRRMQIAGAVVDDGDAHRSRPGSGNRPMTSDGDGGPRRTGAAIVRLRRGRPAAFRRRVCGAFVHAAKKRRSADFGVLADHEAEHLPAAPRQASSAGCVAASKPISSATSSLPKNCTPAARRSAYKPLPMHDADHEIADEAPATAGAQQPQRRQHEGPEIKSVAHEHEAFGIACGFARCAAAVACTV